MTSLSSQVPCAIAGPIPDAILAQAVTVADRAIGQDRLSPEGAALLMLVTGPLLGELIAWRRAARSAGQDGSPPARRKPAANVVRLPPPPERGPGRGPLQ